MKIFSLILCSIIIISCQSKQNDIDKSKIGKIKKVLILGNSIVRVPKDTAGGEWQCDCGAAASVVDSDFVHVLIRDIHAKDPSVKINFLNIADFEREFPTYNLNKLDSVTNPDLVILKLSENVDDKKATDSNFILHFNKLIDHIDSNHQAVKVIVDGFWVKGVNSMLTNYAKEKKYPFIQISDLGRDSSNAAWGKFKNVGIQAHPGDKGMRLIAERIWAYVGNYYQ